MKALIDMGATGEFIDIEFVWSHELRTYRLPRPITVYNVDGTPNESGCITEAVDLVVRYKDHTSQSTFYVSNIGHKAIILGHTWLAEHNPDINWHTGEVRMTCCPVCCGPATREDTSSISQSETQWDNLEWVNTALTVSTRLAEAARDDSPPLHFEDIVPELYLGFQDIFSKESFDKLPE